jgi:hypothetical protein
MNREHDKSRRPRIVRAQRPVRPPPVRLKEATLGARRVEVEWEVAWWRGRDGRTAALQLLAPGRRPPPTHTHPPPPTHPPLHPHTPPPPPPPPAAAWPPGAALALLL